LLAARKEWKGKLIVAYHGITTASNNDDFADHDETTHETKNRKMSRDHVRDTLENGYVI
jgi:hypothetical protein